MAETHYSFLDTAHPFHTKTLPKIPRKSLHSPQPSEELLLFSPLDQSFDPGKASSVEEATTIPLRRSSHIDPSDHPGSAARSERVREQTPWRPGFWIRFPVLGIGALFLTVACMRTFDVDRSANKYFQVR